MIFDGNTVISYPEDFVRRVKELFPTSDEINKLIDKGSYTVGYRLMDALDDPLTNDEIIQSENFKDLKNKAEFLKTVDSLLDEWYDIVEGIEDNGGIL